MWKLHEPMPTAVIEKKLDRKHASGEDLSTVITFAVVQRALEKCRAPGWTELSLSHSYIVKVVSIQFYAILCLISIGRGTLFKHLKCIII